MPCRHRWPSPSTTPTTPHLRRNPVWSPIPRPVLRHHRRSSRSATRRRTHRHPSGWTTPPSTSCPTQLTRRRRRQRTSPPACLAGTVAAWRRRGRHREPSLTPIARPSRTTSLIAAVSSEALNTRGACRTVALHDRDGGHGDPHGGGDPRTPRRAPAAGDHRPRPRLIGGDLHRHPLGVDWAGSTRRSGRLQPPHEVAVAPAPHAAVGVDGKAGPQVLRLRHRTPTAPAPTRHIAVINCSVPQPGPRSSDEPWPQLQTEPSLNRPSIVPRSRP